MLLATNDVSFNALAFYRLAKLFRDTLYDLPLAALAFFQRFIEYPIAHRVEISKAKVFKFDLKPVNAQTVCDGCVDIESLARDAPLLAGWHRAKRLHVVQAIGELHENDANVLDHREHHFAEAFSLCLCPAVKLNLVEFADAVNEQRDFVAELFFYFFERRFGVLNRIVQDRRHDRLGIEVHLGELLSDSDGVRNVGFPGLAGLAFVCGGTKCVGSRDLLDLLRGQVGLQGIEQAPQTVVALRCARQLGEQCRGIVHATIILNSGA